LIRKKQGKPLSSWYIQIHFPKLYAAGCYYYGNWENTITAQGLDYDETRLQEEWDAQKIVDEILSRKKQGKRLNPQHVKEYCGDLYKAGLRYFGSWQNTIETAGLDYREVSLYLTSKMMVGKITKEKLNKMKKFTTRKGDQK
jgi:hypothetical protein